MEIFRKGPGPYALSEAMTGVRLGERLLYVGAGDPRLFAALAAKTGLTGRARAVVESEAASQRLTQAAARAGILVEIAVATASGIPADDGAFDVAVIDATGGGVVGMAAAERAALGREILRALRPLGRAVVVERESRGVLAAFKAKPEGLDRFRAEDAGSRMLEAGGFHPVRILAERDGERFTEGWKRPE
jgi:ubiquinone/menaquinone biosynthesis C-methylase UbiE